MKVLSAYPLPKYHQFPYQPVGFDIYRNIERDCFAFCCEVAEETGQYPLEDLLGQYSLSCGDYTGTATEPNGRVRHLIELETSATDKQDFLNLLTCSTMVGKTIVNFPCGDYDYLGVQFDALSDLVLNGQSLKLPIIGWRGGNHANHLPFDPIFPENLLLKAFSAQTAYQYDLPLEVNFRLIYLAHSKAYLLGEAADGFDYQLCFGVNGPESFEKIVAPN